MTKNYEVEIEEEEVVIDEEIESIINDFGKNVKAWEKEIKFLFQNDDEDYLINRLNAY